MSKSICVTLLLIAGICFAQEKKSSEKFILAFELKPNDLELSRLAQPTQYFDKIGRRAGLMGYESGQFEMWVWPWKPLRNFELQFLLGTSTQPILAKDIVHTISVTPEVTTLTFTYEAFTVKEHIFIPRNEPGAILLLDVHTTTPLAIIPGFIPVMQPMWPAGVGGQFSYWDDDVNGYVISEGQWRAEFICGSPAGQQMAAPPAHMFADNPLQFRIDVKPGETDGKFIPIVIAGAVPDTSTCGEQLCPWQKMKFDSVKATYSRLWKNAEKYYNECYNYYQNLRNSTMQVITPDKEMNLAYEWGKVALDNLMIVNPRLGYGMVAGFGFSGGGARPGFGWFFGGDAFINSMAMNSVGMFQQSRDALAFTQKWQRQENFPIRKKNPSDLLYESTDSSSRRPKDVGKMAHELSQSDGLCDWWNDYHYGYNHADTTPWYIVAMADYVRTSGDVEFLKQSWKSVKQAYDWCLSKDSDNDGLMDLKGAGLGALEFGKLVGIYADVYTCGVWVQAIKEMKYMAELVGDSTQARQADGQFKKAQPQLEKKFWMEKEGFYSYGATEKGEQVHEKTPWSGVAMMFGLLDEERTAKSIEAFNSADLCTDWGVRSLSNKSPLFEPTNYNYGAVWPFISSFFNTAQFKHHYSLSGYQILQSNIKHVFDHALGVVPEVFSGELNEKLGEAYHHQGFSTTGYMLPLVGGLLGLKVDALNKAATLSPHLPSDWYSVQNGQPIYRLIEVRNLIIGIDTVQLILQRIASSNGALLASEGGFSISGSKRGPGKIRILCSPASEPGTDIHSLNVNRDNLYLQRQDKEPSLSVSTPTSGQDRHCSVTLEFARIVDAGVKYRNAVPIGSPLLETSLGDKDRSLKIVSVRSDNNKMYLTVEGLSNHSYELSISLDSAARVSGAQYEKGKLRIIFEDKPKPEFIRKEIVIQLK